jgi:hypothetical protein
MYIGQILEPIVNLPMINIFYHILVNRLLESAKVYVKSAMVQIIMNALNVIKILIIKVPKNLYLYLVDNILIIVCKVDY